MTDYSVTRDMEDANIPSTTFIDGGIQEDILLVNVEYNTTKNGNEYLAFYFENKFGDKLSHTEWPVRPFKSMEEMSAEEKENFLTKIDNQKKRIKQIVTTFVSADKYDFVATTFKEYAEKIVELLKDNLRSVPVRVKVVYNKKNFTTLPNYWKYKFIEPMTVPAEQSKIRILNIDNISKNSPTVISNSIVDIPVVKDDLPF